MTRIAAKLQRAAARTAPARRHSVCIPIPGSALGSQHLAAAQASAIALGLHAHKYLTHMRSRMRRMRA